jgi:beta-N-acetylhexosaminidase
VTKLVAELVEAESTFKGVPMRFQFIIPTLILVSLWVCLSGCGFKPKHVPTLKEKIGQMVMVGFHGTTIDDADLLELKQQIHQGEVGGIVFYAYNIKDKPQTLKLLSDFKMLETPVPLFFAIDQEGGLVQRLTQAKGFTDYPAADTVAKTLEGGQAFRLYRKLANELKRTGFNLNFAPVVDVNVDLNSPAIGKLGRSFSSDPKRVVHLAEIVIRAHHKEKMLTAIKHFPGHGSAHEDTHTGFVDVTKTWKPDELLPYKRLISWGKVDMVMTAHIFNSDLDPVYPASLSSRNVQGWLRKGMKYRGVVISDDLQMGAISQQYELPEVVLRVVNSGTDILLFSNFFLLDKELPWKIQKILLQAVQEGKISENRIDESYRRIMRLKARI